MKNKIGVNLQDLLSKTVEAFNRYRSPEATAKLVDGRDDGFTIEFEGPFCMRCGVTDYFEDFIQEFENIGNAFRVKINEYRPTGPQSFNVHYRIEKHSSDEVDGNPAFLEFLLENGLSSKDYVAANPCTKDVIKLHFRTWLFERNQAAYK